MRKGRRLATSSWVMVYITATTWVFFLGLVLIVGISAWLGYLIGRVRTLDPYRGAGTPAQQARAAFVFGSVLVVFGLVLVDMMFGNGTPQSMDGGGALMIALTAFMLLFGGYKMVTAILDVRARG